MPTKHNDTTKPESEPINQFGMTEQEFEEFLKALETWEPHEEP